MNRNYCIATPIGPGRSEDLNQYKAGIERLYPRPNTVGLVTTEKIYSNHFAEDNLYKLIATPHPQREKKHRYENIAYNREQLRKWFVKDRDEGYIFWVDSDVEIIYANTAEKLIDLAEQRNVFITNNPYQGRFLNNHNEYYPWWGCGCTMVSRRAAAYGRFYAPKYIKSDGSTERDREDLTFFGCIKGLQKKIESNGYEPFGEDEHYNGSLYFEVEYGAIPVVHHIDELEFSERDFTRVLSSDKGNCLDIETKNIEKRLKGRNRKRENKNKDV